MKESCQNIYSQVKEFEDLMKHEGKYNGEAKNDGDYKICLDNKGSTWSDKTVWLEIQIEDPEDDYDEDDIGQGLVF